MGPQDWLEAFRLRGAVKQVSVMSLSGHQGYSVDDERAYFGAEPTEPEDQMVAVRVDSDDEPGELTAFVRRIVVSDDCKIDGTIMVVVQLDGGPDLSSPEMADVRRVVGELYAAPLAIPYLETAAASLSGLLGGVRRFPGLPEGFSFEDDSLDDFDDEDVEEPPGDIESTA